VLERVLHPAPATRQRDLEKAAREAYENDDNDVDDDE
jgi:hypothetical protein